MSTKRKTRTPKATLIGWRDGDARLTALEDQLRELVEARAKHNENMLRWRKTTNDLIDTLDRGLRKLEEKSEANAEHQELAARIDGLKADFERFRSDARERLASLEEKSTDLDKGLNHVELMAEDAQHRISMQIVELPGRERALLNVIIALANPKESKLP